MTDRVVVVGAGLAGCECAFQLAERGIEVTLVEQKPEKRTPAQTGNDFAELVCSNSFRGAALHNAVGLLKEELRRAGSLVMAVGEETRVPAGGAFAVDRELFSRTMTERVKSHPRISVESREVTAIPTEGITVLATGPLTGDALAEDLATTIGSSHLAYYDAIAPVVSADSIDLDVAFRASRYDKGNDDAYINCPLDEAQYHAFIEALLAAEKVAPREFEKIRYFEGCLPIETLAERGVMTLAFGCMKPVGLVDPRTDKRAFGVVQLRQEDVGATAYNLVGFQTRMKWPEQQRVFRMIPGLERAEFQRFGSVHRNTFVNSPVVLDDTFALRARPSVYLAGQVSGVEGYVESSASGFVVGITLAARLRGEPDAMPPRETALGSLMSHVRTPRDDYQPSNVVFAMFPPYTGSRKKMSKNMVRDRQVETALQALDGWASRVGATEIRARIAPARAETQADPTAESTVTPESERAVDAESA